MKRLFLLTALVTLACSGEAGVTNADPQGPDAQDPNQPEVPTQLDPGVPPRSSGSLEVECGGVFDRDCETDSAPGDGSQATVLYTGSGDGEHWLATAGDSLLFTDGARESVLAVSLASGEISVVADQQPGLSWIGADEGVGVWTTQREGGTSLEFQDLRSGKGGLLAQGFETPERPVIADGLVLWYDWASLSIVGVSLDQPGRVVSLVVDASACSPTVADGFLYYASERDQGSIRRVPLSQELEAADSELVIGKLGQKIAGFGNHSTHDLQVVDGELWFTSGVEGGSVWHVDADGVLENAGGTHKYARNLTVVDGQAYWVTYGGSFEQRDGTLWTVPTHGRLATASEAASGEPRVVLEQVGWVERLGVANGTLFYSTSRIPDVFSVERQAIPALED